MWSTRDLWTACTDRLGRSLGSLRVWICSKGANKRMLPFLLSLLHAATGFCFLALKVHAVQGTRPPAAAQQQIPQVRHVPTFRSGLVVSSAVKLITVYSGVHWSCPVPQVVAAHHATGTHNIRQVSSEEDAWYRMVRVLICAGEVAAVRVGEMRKELRGQPQTRHIVCFSGTYRGHEPKAWACLHLNLGSAAGCMSPPRMLKPSR